MFQCLSLALLPALAAAQGAPPPGELDPHDPVDLTAVEVTPAPSRC